MVKCFDENYEILNSNQGKIMDKSKKSKKRKTNFKDK